jgi:putative holliday junction resolvase
LKAWQVTCDQGVCILRILALDVGDRRIGIAISDPLAILARPFSVLERGEDDTTIAVLKQLIDDQQAGLVIVGLPRSMDGSFGSQSDKVRQFAEKLKMATAIPLEFRDERLTTVSAKSMLEERGQKRTYFVKKGAYDAAAAAVILQSFLNESRPLSFPGEAPENS